MDDIRRRSSEVAEFNPNPRWPRGYFEVLEELWIPDKHHSFYAHWVRQVFARELRSRRRRDLGSAETGFRGQDWLCSCAVAGCNIT